MQCRLAEKADRRRRRWRWRQVGDELPSGLMARGRQSSRQERGVLVGRRRRRGGRDRAKADASASECFLSELACRAGRRRFCFLVVLCFDSQLRLYCQSDSCFAHVCRRGSGSTPQRQCTQSREGCFLCHFYQGPDTNGPLFSDTKLEFPSFSEDSARQDDHNGIGLGVLASL